MLCAAPFRQGVAEFGCGKCSACLMKRRRLWTARLMLESQLHESSLFVTLTYDKEHLPCGMSVSIRDAQLFLKRLRDRVSPVRVRYFIVGEYGDVSQRPHYHAVLFGAVTPDQVRESWKMGFTHVGLLTAASASYVVSYTTKRMTVAADVRLGGRCPEFARMSLRPGLGAGAMEVIADALFTRGGASAVAVLGDVPSAFRAEGKLQPLGRYLKNRLRVLLGMDEGMPAEARDILDWAQYVSLLTVGSALHESKRIRDGHRSRGYIRLANSLKGL